MPEGWFRRRSAGNEWITPAVYRDSFLGGLRGAPILSREQEAHLFRQMNYLKCLAARLRDRIDPRGALKPRLPGDCGLGAGGPQCGEKEQARGGCLGHATSPRLLQ